MRRAWALHAIVLVVVLAALLLAMAYATGGFDEMGFAMLFAFAWIPFALVYTLLSTVMVRVLRPGRPGVVLAHLIALALGALVPLFWLQSSAPHH